MGGGDHGLACCSESGLDCVLIPSTPLASMTDIDVNVESHVHIVQCLKLEF